MNPTMTTVDSRITRLEVRVDGIRVSLDEQKISDQETRKAIFLSLATLEKALDKLEQGQQRQKGFIAGIIFTATGVVSAATYLITGKGFH